MYILCGCNSEESSEREELRAAWTAVHPGTDYTLLGTHTCGKNRACDISMVGS